MLQRTFQQLVVAPFIGLIKLYKYLISPWLGSRCRFYPSCSAYSAEALTKHGLIKGGGMVVRRVASCHPWHPGGFDPVP